MEALNTAWEYPCEDDMAETLLHMLIRTLLFELVQRHLGENGRQAMVGSEQFIYWVEGNPHKTMAPDLYVLFGHEQDSRLRTWKTWEMGKAPDFVLEVASDEFTKDYQISPRRCAEAGVQELVIYDPGAGQQRVRWQVYRRNAKNQLVEVYRGNKEQVESTELQCTLVEVIETDGTPRVRLAVDEVLVPTAQERIEAAHREIAELKRKLDTNNKG